MRSWILQVLGFRLVETLGYRSQGSGCKVKGCGLSECYFLCYLSIQVKVCMIKLGFWHIVALI